VNRPLPHDVGNFDSIEDERIKEPAPAVEDMHEPSLKRDARRADAALDMAVAHVNLQAWEKLASCCRRLRRHTPESFPEFFSPIAKRPS